MKTIAQQIKWDFEANGELIIRDKNGRTIYYEDSNGYWEKYERNSQGKVIYYEDSNRVWEKSEYDSQGRLIYRENSFGRIIDKRPKPCENKIVEIDGEKFKLVKV